MGSIMNNNKLGKMIKQQRLRAKLTLNQLSLVSGVSVSHLSRVEKGERFPSASILRKIAKPLGVDEAELFISAGFLPPQSSTEVGSSNAGRLDPYVAAVLAQEPVDVQRTVIEILSILKRVAKSVTKQGAG